MVAGNREGRGGRRDREGEERGGKGRGGERRSGEKARPRETMPAAFPLLPPTPPGVPACNKGLVPLLSPLWNHVHRHIPKSLSPGTGVTKACATTPDTEDQTQALTLFSKYFTNCAISSVFKKRVCVCVLKCVCRHMPQHACGSQRSWFSPFTLGVFIAGSLLFLLCCALQASRSAGFCCC